MGPGAGSAPAPLVGQVSGEGGMMQQQQQSLSRSLSGTLVTTDRVEGVGRASMGKIVTMADWQRVGSGGGGGGSSGMPVTTTTITTAGATATSTADSMVPEMDWVSLFCLFPPAFISTAPPRLLCFDSMASIWFLLGVLDVGRGFKLI